ncbi:hypothetical protein [Rubritalea tangerina]|uniref:hypothetical protein n=1 Tax=Rubritalea tangerina TaxID=430798 RepID=UPI003622A398
MCLLMNNDYGRLINSTVDQGVITKLNPGRSFQDYELPVIRYFLSTMVCSYSTL